MLGLDLLQRFTRWKGKRVGWLVGPALKGPPGEGGGTQNIFPRRFIIRRRLRCRFSALSTLPTFAREARTVLVPYRANIRT